MVCRVLIVADDPGVIDALRRELLRPPHIGIDGIEIQSFTSPTEALTHLARAGAVCDVAIVDYRMPAMDGIPFLACLRDLQPQAVRILLTGTIDLEGALGAINEARADHLLAKPWFEYDLKGRVALAVHQRQLAAGHGNKPSSVVDAHQPLNVLLVGDPAHLSSPLAQALGAQAPAGKTLALKIRCAALAAHALQSVHEHAPDLVFANDTLIDMEGIELLLQLRGRFPHAVRILVSGNVGLNLVADAISIAGVYHVLPNPWQDNDLPVLLGEALRYRALLGPQSREARP